MMYTRAVLFHSAYSILWIRGAYVIASADSENCWYGRGNSWDGNMCTVGLCNLNICWWVALKDEELQMLWNATFTASISLSKRKIWPRMSLGTRRVRRLCWSICETGEHAAWQGSCCIWCGVTKDGSSVEGGSKVSGDEMASEDWQ